MSNLDTPNVVPARDRAIDALAPGDREWLAARLEEYRELLQYLHDH